MDWIVHTTKDNFPSGTKKCNKFIYDVLEEAGVTAPKYDYGFPVVAADWANSSFTIPDWKHMGYGASWERGDIIAERRNYTDATGHCGIAISNSQVIGARGVGITKEGHDFGDNVTVRRYIGQ